LKAALEDMRGGVSDIAITVEDLIEEDDKAAGRFSFRGMLAAPGQALEGSGLVYLVVADDLVTELWIYPDPYAVMAVMSLVGMATPVAAASAPAAREVMVAGAGTYVDVSPADFAAMLAAKTFRLINVHVPYEGEIEGTDLFIPFDQIEQRRAELPSDTGARLVLYCRTGRMSAIAAESLVKLGYTDVWNLAGGMVAWEQAGYPLVTNER
jgi:phage shock protein E